MVKKAYVRTEIIRYLNQIENEDGEPLTWEDVFELLPEIYEQLKKDPEQPLGGIDYRIFEFAAQAGFQIGQQRAAFGM